MKMMNRAMSGRTDAILEFIRGEGTDCKNLNLSEEKD